jgi:hypothetical protein
MKMYMKTKIISLLLISSFIFTATPVFATYGIQTKTSHCVAGVLPDPECSPGAVLTTDSKIVCVVGYTKKVRAVTTTTMKKVFKEYDLPWSTRSNYEVDHIISLELGGSNDISNLFPESYTISNGARVKDTFENYLHSQVCKGLMTLPEAQKEISGDWLSYYQQWKTPKDTVKTTTPTPATTAQTKTPVVSSPVIISEPAVKKSTTGICHAKGTTYYARTTNYVAYSTADDCLASGGRLPK